MALPAESVPNEEWVMVDRQEFTTESHTRPRSPRYNHGNHLSSAQVACGPTSSAAASIPSTSSFIPADPDRFTSLYAVYRPRPPPNVSSNDTASETASAFTLRAASKETAALHTPTPAAHSLTTQSELALQQSQPRYIPGKEITNWVNESGTGDRLLPNNASPNWSIAAQRSLSSSIADIDSLDRRAYSSSPPGSDVMFAVGAWSDPLTFDLALHAPLPLCAEDEREAYSFG